MNRRRLVFEDLQTGERQVAGLQSSGNGAALPFDLSPEIHLSALPVEHDLVEKERVA